MAVLDVSLVVLLVFATGYLAILALRDPRPVYKGAAIALSIFGLVLLSVQVTQLISPGAQGTHKNAQSMKEVTSEKNVASLKLNGEAIIGEKINLSKEAINKETISKEKFFILDASQGVSKENLVILQTIFEGLKLEEVPKEEKLDICWRRQSLFTIATGLCQVREAKWMFNAGSEDLTRVKNLFSTAKMIEVGKARVLLLTHLIPEKDPSIEEKCLQTLLKGEACAAVEILPSAATAALSITSTDPTVQSVLEEFSVATPKDIGESLSIYSGSESPLLENLKGHPTSEISSCGGLFLTPVLRMKIANLDEISENLKLADTESKLSKEAKQLTQFLSCPGLSHLDLPKLKKRDLKTSARSFMTHAMKYSFWFTDVKSYLSRFNKIQSVQLGTDETAQKVKIKTAEAIKGLSITFMLPTRFPEEMLQALNVTNAGADWSVYRMGASSFRVSIDKLTADTTIDLSSFFSLLQGKRLGLQSFFGSVGVLPALQVSFILATLLCFVHITASRRPVLWVMTFSPVFVIAFILVFLSIVSSRLPSGSDTSFAQMENPSTPVHLFLRDWPDDWFEKPHAINAKLALMGQQQSEKWTKNLKEAERLANNSKTETDVQFLSQNLLYKQVVPGDRGVVVWDYPKARNFYFRKSSVYQALILGWRELSANSKDVQVSSASDFAQLADTLKRSVLVVPDIRFLSDADLAGIDQYVKNGGILVFSEKLDSESTPNEFKDNGAFVEVLKKAGLGKSVAANYSKVNIEGISVDSINTSHRLIKPDGRLVQGEKWGVGAALFLGVQPIDSRSRTLLTKLMARLQGEKIVIQDVGGGCATSLFVQPWAASLSTLDSFARTVRQRGFDVRWMLDPVSLAKMSPTWENRLRSDGVVFLDDGKAVTRKMAGELLKALGGQAARPIFVSLNQVNQEKLEGPPGDLIVATQVDAADLSYAAKLWNSDCKLGLAKPRFISGTSSDDWNRRARDLLSYGPQNLSGLNTYLQRLRDLKQTSNDTKEIKFNSQNPLEIVLEQR